MKLDSVSHVFEANEGDQVETLRDIDLLIPDSEIVYLIEPSGCGKSTLPKSIADFFKSSSGLILDSGSEVIGPTIECGVVFRYATLFPWFTVAENISLSNTSTGTREHADKGQRLLDTAGPSESANRYPYELLGDTQQRAQIVRVPAVSPYIVLTDESFGALDPFTREQLQVELLGTWQRHCLTIIFVTHSVEGAFLLGHRVVVTGARSGRIIDDMETPRSLRVSETNGITDDRLWRLWEVPTNSKFVDLKVRTDAGIYNAHTVN